MTAIANNTFWLTGASSGIGEALTYELNRRGAKLIISSRQERELRRVKESCPQPENIHILPLDLSDTTSHPALVKEALSFNGRIDVMIHNGGISQRSLARETQLSVDRRLMEVNYFGTISLTKALLPQMAKQGGGHFVVVSSLVGKFGSPYRSSYAASKHALHGFFDSLRAEEEQHNIRISLVCPGFVHTNVSVNALTEDGSKLGKMDDAQANGMPPAKCAHQIIKAIEKNKGEVYIGGREVGGIYLKRFFPGIFRTFLSKVKVR